MSDQDEDRRLTTILAADVVGYSRMMSEDEKGTFALLKSRRRDVLVPVSARYSGRIFKLMGDGVFIEFASVVNAVQCADELQKGMEAANESMPENYRIRLRVGVNLGDVMAVGSDLYGDCVNIAARLQTLAAPGGICISESVYQHVASKLQLDFVDLGRQTLKNIAQPLRVFSIGGANVEIAIPEATASVRERDRPSIAVLPFTNMSGDQEQEFFTDGLTEDIITELSRFHDLLVISRNSSFRYKGKAIDVRRAAAELDVGYLVEGSVRKAGNRVRVTVQLIDTQSDKQIWADRYDRQLEDIFAIQDEMTTAIVAILPGRIEAATRERALQKRTENMVAYECVLAGKRLHHRSTREDNEEARRMLDRAIELDPQYAHAYAWKACALGQAWANGYLPHPDEGLREVAEEATKALRLDDNDSDVHRIFAALAVMRSDLDRAIYHQERALRLNPNDDLIVVQQGEVLTWLGKAEEGINWIQRAMRLNPYHPERFWSHLGRARFVGRMYEGAVQALKRITALDIQQSALLAACYARLGEKAEADRLVAEILRNEPEFTVAAAMLKTHYKDASDADHHRESLVMAGLPI